MFRMFTVFCFFNLVFTSTDIAFCCEPPFGIVRWLETANKYKDLTCEIKTFWQIDQGTKVVDKIRSIKVDFASRVYWERYVWDAEGLKITSERSFGDGLIRSFRKSTIDKKTGKEMPDSGAGFIEVLKDDSDRMDVFHPGNLTGFQVTRNLGGNWLDVDSIANCEIVSKPDGKSFVFKNVFGWKTDGVYDLHVTLSKEHDYLPNRICAFTRTSDGETAGHEILVSEFKKFQDLWLPVKYRLKDGLQFEVAVSSVKLNTGLKVKELQAQFPPTKQYLDFRDDYLYLNGTRVRKNVGEQTAQSSTQISTVVIASLTTGMVVIVVSFYLRRRRMRMVLPILLLFFCLAIGCKDDRQRDGKTNRFANNSDVIDVSPSSTQAVEILVGSERKELRFTLTNQGPEPIVFDQTVRATCGCTRAELSKLRILPGETADVLAELDVPRMPGHKIVQLTVIQILPVKSETYLTIDTTFRGDWFVESNELRFKGVAGSESRSSIRIYGRADITSTVKFPVNADFFTIDGDVQQENWREISVSRKLSLETAETIIGDFVLVAEGRNPSECTIRVSERASTPAKWAPAAILLKRDEAKICDLKIDSDWELSSFEDNEQLEIEKSTQPNTFKIKLRDATSSTEGKIIMLNALVKNQVQSMAIPLYVAVDRKD